MNEQKTIEDVLVVLQGMQKSFDRLESAQSGMITKEDAKNFATKDDLKNFATKDDIVALQEDLEFMKEHMVTKVELAESESRMLTHIDGLAQQYIKCDHEIVAGIARSERLEDRVQVLELRMKITA